MTLNLDNDDSVSKHVPIKTLKRKLQRRDVFGRFMRRSPTLHANECVQILSERLARQERTLRKEVRRAELESKMCQRKLRLKKERASKQKEQIYEWRNHHAWHQNGEIMPSYVKDYERQKSFNKGRRKT